MHADCLRAWLRGEDSEEADIGGWLVSKFMLSVTGLVGALSKKK